MCSATAGHIIYLFLPSLPPSIGPSFQSISLSYNIGYLFGVVSFSLSLISSEGDRLGLAFLFCKSVYYAFPLRCCLWVNEHARKKEGERNQRMKEKVQIKFPSNFAV